ncbi:hypothetical protein Agub_g16042, partial [Astrephomene gubernaculifera]
MNEASRCWGSLPSDALAQVVNAPCLAPADVAAVRLVCSHWRSTACSHLRTLAPGAACSSPQRLARLAERFPCLTACDLSRCDTSLVGHASLCSSARCLLAPLLASLAPLRSLTRLTLSAAFSQQMGQKHWAAALCAGALPDPPSPPTAPPAAAATAAGGGAAGPAASLPSSSSPPPPAAPAPPAPAAGSPADALAAAPPAVEAGAGAAHPGPFVPPHAPPPSAADPSGGSPPDEARSDPGVGAFTRSLAHPGAALVPVYWLPDWGAGMPGLREVQLVGPSPSPPPPHICPHHPSPAPLLWLHAGRTAPHLAALSLTRVPLGGLPEGVGLLGGLTRLEVQDCSLSHIPPGLLGGLSRLQRLQLGNNDLVTLPPDVGLLTALTHLDMRRNRLSQLPASLSSLSRLACLRLSHNQLRLPPGPLPYLTALTRLDLSYNWL